LSERKEKGRLYEVFAEEYLKRKKYKILERNFSWRKGEIDIIAEREGNIIFIEVRSKKQGDIRGYETVTPVKQKKIIETAKFYLESKNLLGKREVRFDVISINFKDDEIEIEHFENAFREE